MKYEFVTQTIAAPRVTQLGSGIQSASGYGQVLSNQNLKHTDGKLFHVP